MNTAVSDTMVHRLIDAGIRDRASAEALSTEERDRVLHVGAWCGIEDAAWAQALDVLFGPTIPHHGESDQLFREKDLGAKRVPVPGDAVRLDGDYCGAKTGQRAIIDGSHFGMNFDDGKGPVVLATFSASAFRGSSHGGSEYVSVSGGPCPFIPIAELVHVGTIDQVFWQWKDRPRAGGGTNYLLTVNLWSWKGK